MMWSGKCAGFPKQEFRLRDHIISSREATSPTSLEPLGGLPCRGASLSASGRLHLVQPHKLRFNVAGFHGSHPKFPNARSINHGRRSVLPERKQRCAVEPKDWLQDPTPHKPLMRMGRTFGLGIVPATLSAITQNQNKAQKCKLHSEGEATASAALVLPNSAGSLGNRKSWRDAVRSSNGYQSHGVRVKTGKDYPHDLPVGGVTRQKRWAMPKTVCAPAALIRRRGTNFFLPWRSIKERFCNIAGISQQILTTTEQTCQGSFFNPQTP